MAARNSILIANRGEIAIRIASTAAALGLESVALHSADDAASLHVAKADRAIALPGRGPAAYLDIDAVIEAAIRAKAHFVHPGYGFLSENARFARACAQHDLAFIGPDPETLELFGDKGAARQLARSLGVPVPGGTDRDTSLDEAASFLRELGPGAAMMIKAVSGGGGRGMRIVRDEDELAQAYRRCRSEAKAAFGDDAVYVEAFIARARHVEVQVLGDGSGAVVHLWDRECSLQRRNQKLVEIAPALIGDAGLRAAMIEAACAMARARSYRGLATFEFLVETGGTPRFSFIEANPRIQVEHTVTEMVTGIDLVEAQIRVVRGESLADLGFPSQVDVPRPAGHAIQLRINLERIEADGSVTPTGGTITAVDLPAGLGIRVDGCGYTGYRTNPAFDPLLAKIIVHARQADYSAALARAVRALSETRIEGVETNVPFLRRLLACPAVESGDFDTRFIEDNLASILAMKLPASRLPESPAAAAERSVSAAPSRLPAEGVRAVAATMQGLIVHLDVAEGAQIGAGTQLGIIEAMKMQMPLVAPCAGRILAMFAAVGDVVSAGDVLFHIEEAEDDGRAGAGGDVADPDRIRPELAELRERRAGHLDAARPQAIEKRRASGKRMIRENLAEFFDDGEYQEYGSHTFAAQRSRRSVGELLRISPADGMIAAIGSVNGAMFGAEKARCMTLAYDYTVLAGTQGINAHKKKDRMLQLAETWRIPLMVFAEGGGGRPGDTDHVGISGLDSMTFARFARLNGQVPLVGVVTGRCFAGNAALLGCCDVIIATRDSSIGMAGPAMIEGGGLGVFRPEEVGPSSVQEPNGVIDILVEDEAAAIAAARQYLSYFQGEAPAGTCPDQRLLRHAVPQNRLRAYDVHAVIDLLADAGSITELRPAFAPGMVTSLIRIEGRPVGLIANNPMVLGGAIDGDCADKATRFLQLCDAFGLPVLSLCDTPGFMVGPQAERKALVRHVSRMFVTAAGLRVPFVTVVLRKGYGLGAMAMAGGSFHACDATFAWPTGEFGGMGLEGAVRLAYRNELAAAEEGTQRDALFARLVAEKYEEGKALAVAAALEIDDVIDPADTRSRILGVLAAQPADRGAPARARIDTW